MSIPAFSSVSGVSAAGYLPAVKPAASGDSGAAFAASLGGAVDSIQAQQSHSSTLAVRAVTGDLADVHEYTIAATEAAVTLELAATVRTKMVDAFSEIMRMQG